MAKHLDSTNITILAAVSHDDERAAPSSIFSDEIDCVKFITISKATKEKNRFIPAEILFSPETDILGRMKFLLNNFFISSTVVILSDPPLR